ncbi:MAG: UxaA family hydrolase [Chloroflexi bacterium]|nr:UxaA family hydrolase [Chloroflexota bacterium]
MKVNVLLINPRDSVVTALQVLAAGTKLAASDAIPALQTCETVPMGHKVAIRDIAEGEHVIKYGASIGVASQAIRAGQHVHTHNLRSLRGAVKHA